MCDVGILISIMLGFAILTAAVHTKETDFESCVRHTSNALPEDYQGERRDLALVTLCQPK